MSLEENKTLVRRLFSEAIGKGNADAVGEFLVPNSLLFGFVQRIVVGQATGIPDAQIKIEELFGEGDKVTVCATLSGTNTRSIRGHSPTNKEITIDSIWVLTVRNGRVISMRLASDMLEQLWLAGST